MMKKIIATIMCLIFVMSINLVVHAAENAVACPNQCGGVVVYTPVENEYTNGPADCTLDHKDCETYTTIILRYDKYECTGSCGYILVENVRRTIKEIVHRTKYN